MDGMNFRIHHPLIQPSSLQKQKIHPAKSKSHSFNEILKAELNHETKLKISKHAESRFRERGISLTNETWEKVEQAVQHARNKGVKEALILTSKAALVVSTVNELIITALDRKSASEHVFTNIDGTIVIDE